jgi:hypothetical protein
MADCLGVIRNDVRFIGRPDLTLPLNSTDTISRHGEILAHL